MHHLGDGGTQQSGQMYYIHIYIYSIYSHIHIIRLYFYYIWIGMLKRWAATLAWMQDLLGIQGNGRATRGTFVSQRWIPGWQPRTLEDPFRIPHGCNPPFVAARYEICRLFYGLKLPERLVSYETIHPDGFHRPFVMGYFGHLYL